MQPVLTNHDILVALILERMGPLSTLKDEILKRTGRKYITRMTIERAFRTAARYVLGNDVYLPTIQVSITGNKVEITPVTSPSQVIDKLGEIGGTDGPRTDY